MHPKPKVNFVLALLMAFGRFVAKADAKLWLDDMHYELAFIEGLAAKLHFAWGALELAFKSRFETVSMLSSRRLVMATAIVATLVAVVLFIPRSILSPQPTTQSMPAPVLAPEPAADADLVQPAPAVAAEAAMPVSPRMAESANSIEADLNDRAASSGAGLLSEESADAATDDAFEGSVTEAPSELTLSETELGQVAASQASPLNSSNNAIVSESLDPPYLALELDSSVLSIRALRATELTVDAESQVEYQLEEGQALSLALPVSLSVQTMSSLLLFDGDLPIQGFMAQGYVRVDARQKVP